MIFKAFLKACLIATEIAPSGSGVDSSRDCSLVDCFLVDFDGGQVDTWTDTVWDEVLIVRHLL